MEIFAFDQTTKVGGDKLTRMAVANVSVTYGGQGLKEGEGGFIVTSNGIAGVLTGVVDIQGGGVQASGKLGLRVNKTGAAVDEAITVGAKTVAIQFGSSEGDVFAFFGAGLSFSVGGFVTIEGNISFTSSGGEQVFAGDGFDGVPGAGAGEAGQWGNESCGGWSIVNGGDGWVGEV